MWTPADHVLIESIVWTAVKACYFLPKLSAGAAKIRSRMSILTLHVSKPNDKL